MASPLPLVTLGLPVYNGEKYIEQALQSLKAQTWPALEILISDNASTDGTAAICQRLAEGDARIRYIRQPTNIGAKNNFDFLVEEARG
jgi:glycosyltransferase involved in cell wall biosynthesis